MIDEREIVRVAVERLAPPEPSYERLVQRRDRKRRNQRIAAGVVGIAVFVAAVWIVTSGGWFDRTQTPAAPGGSETGSTETGSSVAPDPDEESLNGLPPDGATPSTPESGELVVELNNRVWVYADGRVISSVYLPALEPYSGLVEQRLTPEGVEFLRSNVLATGLFEHDLDLAREGPMCCLEIRVRDGDRLVRVTLGPGHVHPDPPRAQKVTPEQATALQSLEVLLTSQVSWPTSAWTDQQMRAYVPTSYSFCTRWAEPSRVLSRLPQPARDLLGAGYAKTDPESENPVDCTRLTTEEARALAGILIAEVGNEGGPFAKFGREERVSSLGFSFEEPEEPGSFFLIAMNPVLPHGTQAGLAGFG